MAGVIYCKKFTRWLWLSKKYIRRLMMHVAFCLFEAGSVFQTFSPDKPNIFMPWTTVLDKPKSGEQEHGNCESGPWHLCRNSICSSTARKVGFTPHKQKCWSFGTSLGGLHPRMATVKFDSSISLLSANIPVSALHGQFCVLYFLFGGRGRERWGDCRLQDVPISKGKATVTRHFPARKSRLLLP